MYLIIKIIGKIFVQWSIMFALEPLAYARVSDFFNKTNMIKVEKNNF